MHNDWNWHNWGMPMMWFIWIPLIILVVWLLIKLVNKDGFSASKKESPLDVLKKRYANGEISIEEYQERKKILESE